jgi:hypothetical protein
LIDLFDKNLLQLIDFERLLIALSFQQGSVFLGSEQPWEVEPGLDVDGAGALCCGSGRVGGE